MSAKWRNSLEWDDRFFPVWAWPAKFVLRAFSSIALAVLLLSLVALFGILASTPIGMLALIPTVLVYAGAAIAAVAIGGLLPAWLLSARLKGRVGRGTRFIASFAALGGLGALSMWAWLAFAWPRLRYDEAAGTGLRFFAGFVNEYRALTIRRLPGMEMSELEFYSWWPLELILLLFVLNLMVATVRRIDFTVPKIGVLTVHTGIITIALGSVYYAALKQEGDVLLLAGQPDAAGNPSPGQIERGFFDNTQPVLWIRQSDAKSARPREQRALRGLPRYNDYNLTALGKGVGDGADEHASDRGRTLDLPVPRGMGMVDPDLAFRVVGYASYANLVQRWRPVEAGDGGTGAVAAEANPIRIVELHSKFEGETGGEAAAAGGAAARPTERVDDIPFLPLAPADRLAMLGQFVAIEYTRGMDEARWEALRSPLDAGVRHALLIEVPGMKYRKVVPITEGQKIEAAGYAIEVRGIMPAPPFPIITKGYEGATSSVAVVDVTPPEILGGAKAAFTRYVYHRFPEINQDMLAGEVNERGMPKRRNADKSIILTYIDASIVQVYLDEMVPAGRAGGGDAVGESAPMVRALVRVPGGGGGGDERSEPRVIEALATGESIPFGPAVSLRLGKRWTHAERVETPVVVPEAQREREAIGNHKQAAIALEVSAADPSRPGGEPAWSRTIWVPFTQYVAVGTENERTITIPPLGVANPAAAGEGGAGRTITVAFGRRWHPFPDLGLQLADFEMFPYPHSSQPRDFRSDVLVFRGRTMDQSAIEKRYTSLNDPLLVKVPFEWSAERPALANAVGWLVSWVAPTQYKFSQAGWDQRGWSQTKEAAERGELPRAFANFTILGVGNNPGIYIIAAGAVMMSLGIPYAFYLKPVVLRRRKQAIQRALARGEYVRPGAGAEVGGEEGGEAAASGNGDSAAVNGHTNGQAASNRGVNRR